MAAIDVLTVFNVNAFPDNSNTPSNPQGQNTNEFAKNKYVRMVSDSDQVSNNGNWNLSITVKNGDEIRWLDTPITQGESQTDMLIYNFHFRSSSAKAAWDKYLTPLASKEFHGTRFYIDSGMGTNHPKYQYVTGPNNYLTAKVKASPTSQVTLSYFLEVVKLELVNGVVTPKGYYGIDPQITIKP